MLTKPLIRDETISSLGKTDNLYAIHIFGEITSLICQTPEIAFHPGTSGTFLVAFHA
jgi:hypothetical protein